MSCLKNDKQIRNIKSNKRTIINNYNEFEIESFQDFISPTSGAVEALKTGRREVPGSNPGRTCRPSCSEFSVVFSNTRINTC